MVDSGRSLRGPRRNRRRSGIEGHSLRYEKRAEPAARANGPERPWLILNVRQRKIAMRVELQVCGASEWARVAQESSRPASKRSRHPRGVLRPARRSKPEKRTRRFTFGRKLFLQQFPRVVTRFPKQKKFTARRAESLESEPNQTLEPTAPSGRGSS